MTISRILTLPLALTLGLGMLACDDGGDGNGNNGGDNAGNNNGGDNAGNNNGGNDGNPVSVSGMVLSVTLAEDVPTPGATVSVVGSDPLNSTTSDDAGNWSLTLPEGATTLLRANFTGRLDYQRQIVVPTGGADEEDLTLIPTTLADAILLMAGGERDESKGHLIVDFNGLDSGAGMRVQIDANSGGGIVFDDDGNPTFSETIINDSVMIFVNVDPGDVTVSFTAGDDGVGTGCALQYPTLTTAPVEANTFTEVDFVCPDDIDDPPPGSATIRGAVTEITDVNEEGEGPSAGATVFIVGADPPVTTTTGADGSFALNVPTGEAFTLRSEKTGFISQQVVLESSSEGIDELELVVIGPNVGDLINMAAQLPDRDDSLGYVQVDFDRPSRMGGEGATLSANHGGSLTFPGGGGGPQASATLMADGDTELIFVNVATGTTQVTLNTPNVNCALWPDGVTEFPVDANTMTTILARCDGPPEDVDDPETVTVSGRVTDAASEAGLDGVQGLADSEGLMEPLVGTSNDSGVWAFELPPRRLSELRFSKDGYHTTAISLEVPDEDLEDLDLPLFTTDVLNDAAAEAGLDVLGDGKGVVIVAFNDESGTGGEMAGLSRASEGSFSFDANGDVQATDTLLDGGDGVLFFWNVDAGQADVTFGGSGNCESMFSSLSGLIVEANVVHVFLANCTPGG